MHRVVAATLLVLAGCAVPGDATVRDVDGRDHRPLRVTHAAAHVLFFVTTDCPIANAYSPEIEAIGRDHRDAPLRFFVVHVDPDVTAERARAHRDAYGLSLPVLLDPMHRLVAATGVTVTPEVAVLLADGRMPYRGRIDDQYPDLGEKRPAPGRRDLRDALRAVLRGEDRGEVRTQAIGCYIPDV